MFVMTVFQPVQIKAFKYTKKTYLVVKILEKEYERKVIFLNKTINTTINDESSGTNCESKTFFYFI